MCTFGLSGWRKLGGRGKKKRKFLGPPFGAPTLRDCETTETLILAKNGLAKNGLAKNGLSRYQLSQFVTPIRYCSVDTELIC